MPALASLGPTIMILELAIALVKFWYIVWHVYLKMTKAALLCAISTVSNYQEPEGRQQSLCLCMRLASFPDPAQLSVACRLLLFL